MFATSHARQALASYRHVSVETGVTEASPHQLIGMLLEGFRDSVAQARGAILDGRSDDKARAIARAIRIVNEGLQGGLDIERGGELASNLSALYAFVTVRLTQANQRNDAAMLAECARLLEPVHDAWRAIDPLRTEQPQ